MPARRKITEAQLALAVAEADKRRHLLSEKQMARDFGVTVSGLQKAVAAHNARKELRMLRERSVSLGSIVGTIQQDGCSRTDRI